MLWKKDPIVEEARKHPAWGPFHRACGRELLFFDHIERQGGKRGDYVATAFTLRDRTPIKLAEGHGKTPIAAVADAYHAAERPVADAELARLQGDLEDDFDMEGMLG